jgi:hypothetical protein
MLRHEIGVLTQAIARALDLDDDGVAQDDRGDDRIAKNLALSAKPVRIMVPQDRANAL